MWRLKAVALLFLAGVAATNAQESRLRTVRTGRYLLAAECPDHCSPDACVYKGTTGSFKCTACLDGFVPNRGGDACVCPPGNYPEVPDGSADVQCVPCPKGSWCPGNYAQLGEGKYDCNQFSDGLTTVTTAATSVNDCVNKPGYYYVKPNATVNTPNALKCGPNSYSGGLDWSGSCTPCVSGFKTNPADNSLKTTANVCKAPPGYYASGRNTVTKCPVGEYHPSYNLDASCFPCADGVTTQAAGSTNATACASLKPGYAPTVQVLDPSNPLTGPITSTRICPQKFFCPGGSLDSAIQACPNGTWTKGLGSTTPAQCLVPPGYRLAGATIVPCKTGADGEFKAGWDRSTSCRPCGKGVYSDNTEWITVFNDDGSTSPLDVAGSSHSCYILPGMALTKFRNDATGKYEFKGSRCNSGSDYGVSTTTYGLDISSCIPCPRNMVTKVGLGFGDATWGYTDPAACVTQPGYGFNGVEGELCPKGYFSAGGDTSACQQCDYGRTTAKAGSQSEGDCVINAGFGLLADNTVQQCPVDSYGPGGSATATCQPCPSHSRSRQIGADSAKKCVMCLGGYGTSWGDSIVANCTACPSGYYGADDRETNACESCLDTTFSFVYKGSLNPFTSDSVTVPHATSKSDCIAQYSQIIDRSWSLDATSGWVTNSAATVEACTAACSADPLCQFITFNYATKTCQLRKAAAASPANTKLVAFKTIPSGPLNDTSARKLLQDSLDDHASGMYTFWADPSADDIGTQQAADASDLDTCMQSCGAVLDCAGISYTVSSSGAFGACKLVRTNASFNSPKRSLLRAIPAQLSPPAATCYNGQQDDGEDGVDCGAACQAACPPQAAPVVPAAPTKPAAAAAVPTPAPAAAAAAAVPTATPAAAATAVPTAATTTVVPNATVPVPTKPAVAPTKP